jgi:hypothetical protein
MRYVAILLTLSLAVLFAQTGSGARKRTRGRADAGLSSDNDGGPLLLGPDTPGRLRTEPPAKDGGIADGGAVTIPDGGSRSAQAQLEELRARIAALEQQQEAQQQQAQQMAAMNAQLQALRQQLADADARRQQEQQQEARHRDAVQSAIGSVTAAQQQLIYGNSSSIGDALDQAQSAFTGQAQRDVQAARTAVQNNDLAAARALLSTAVQDAQAGR